MFKKSSHSSHLVDPGTRLTGAVGVLLLAAALGCGSSGDEGIAPCVAASTTPYAVELPDYFPDFEVPPDNPTTVEGVALGRRLYYDPLLSKDGPLEGHACATCHQQQSSFSSNGPGVSVLSHINQLWTTSWLWNGKIDGGLEEVMEFEVTEFFQADPENLQTNATYQEMTCSAFGTSVLTEDLMANAMAQWMRTLVSYRSKYDAVLQGNAELTAQEALGEEIFTGRGDCSQCHTLPLTTDLEFRNNGVVEFVPNEEFDLGLYVVTGELSDRRKFKTPTLRNVEVTGPYMHDGRFLTLEEVVEHYDNGVYTTSTLDPILTGDGEEYGYELNLTEEEKEALVAFLKTFTDEAVLTDPSLSNPFLYH